MSQPIVLLCDNKRRDLPGLALIAHHLEVEGRQVFIEPIEAWRSVAAAHRPSVVLFNHLLATHLADYSERLASMGVKVAVLPNESLLYNADVMRFNSRRYKENVHVDIYFCWSDHQRRALLTSGYGDTQTEILVAGNPKFDFHFAPWNRLYAPRRERFPRRRPIVLFCSNFCLAHYAELPADEADKFFDIWKKHIPLYADYHGAIAANHRSRASAMDFLRAVVEADKFSLIVRPHPNESVEFYEDWLESLPDDFRSNVNIARNDSIYSVIQECDLEISCETCTTAVESWMCGKPTIELIFEKHPMFYHDTIRGLNRECATADEIVATIDEQLADPEQSAYSSKRGRHLADWCASPEGTAARRIADALGRLADSADPTFQRLTLGERRRGIKLRLLSSWGKPCSYNPFLRLKSALAPARYEQRVKTYEKTITPADVAETRRLLAESLTADDEESA
jgi:surface carbohydrate biosynthesis protein